MPLVRIFISVLTIALLAALIYKADVSALWDALSNVSLGAVLFGLVLVQIQIILSALRWRFTSQRLGFDITACRAIREYYIASFLNQTLPGGVGGDVVRAWRARGNGQGAWKQSAKSVVFERFSGQIALFFLAFGGLMVWPAVAEIGVSTQLAVYVALAIILVAITIFLVVKYVHALHESSLARELSEVFLRRKAWLFHCCASAIILSAYVAVFLVAADATGTRLPWTAALTIIPFCLVAMLIPTGFGGWGTREAAAMALWPMLGASAADGLAASITYGWLSLAGAAPGLVMLIWGVVIGRRQSR